MTKRALWIGVLTWVVIAATGCATPWSTGDGGAVALAPYTNQEAGFRGVAPAECQQLRPGISDCTSFSLVQQVVPGTKADLAASTMQQLGLEAFPALAGTYQGSFFSWDRYNVQIELGKLAELPSMDPTTTVRVDWAVAQMESKTAVISLVTIPEDYEAHRAKYEAVMTHVLYALAPVQ